MHEKMRKILLNDFSAFGKQADCFEERQHHNWLNFHFQRVWTTLFEQFIIRFERLLASIRTLKALADEALMELFEKLPDGVKTSLRLFIVGLIDDTKKSIIAIFMATYWMTWIMFQHQKSLSTWDKLLKVISMLFTLELWKSCWIITLLSVACRRVKSGSSSIRCIIQQRL